MKRKWTKINKLLHLWLTRCKCGIALINMTSKPYMTSMTKLIEFEYVPK